MNYEEIGKMHESESTPMESGLNISAENGNEKVGTAGDENISAEKKRE